jgi:cytosine/adenosine deaminase-related metal-dependent hydrolase
VPTADSSALILMNARVGARDLSSVRIARGRITGLRVRPQPGDKCIDLRGDRVLPGLINAHDHLQLNALPRLKYRDRYAHAKDWIDDIRPRLQFDATLLANNAVPREERLLIGGVKNLLSGVTTVAHHDPLYSCLQEATFPVRVVTRYGWSHSLSLDGAKSVRASHHQTPAGWPWIIHAAEGTDTTAATEFERLESLGCLTANTVIVHGVALSREQQQRLVDADAGLVWCPSSNLHLFARTLDLHTLFAHQRVALGSDSRITGERDLLGELRVAREVAELDEHSLEALVTGP